MSPKFSTVLCSYNKPQYVWEAIESILNQTYQDFELVLVDDNSRQETLDALEPYLDNPKISFFQTGRTEEDRLLGYGGAIVGNYALERCTGEYITFIGDDDLYYPNFFERMLLWMEGHRWDVAFCWQNRINLLDDGTIEERGINFSVTPLENPSFILDGNQIVHKRELLEKIDQPWFPTDFETGSYCDGLYMWKIGEISIWQPVPETLCKKRYTSLSTNVQRI